MSLLHLQIGVVGTTNLEELDASNVNIKILKKKAFQLGYCLYRYGANLLLGGSEGILKYVIRGYGNSNGIIVGINNGTVRKINSCSMNIFSGSLLGLGDFLIPLSSHSIIALPGSLGTLSEVAFSYRIGVPVLFLQVFPNIVSSFAELLEKYEHQKKLNIPVSKYTDSKVIAKKAIESAKIFLNMQEK